MALPGPSTFPVEFGLAPDYVESASRLDVSFPTALCELIDNSIAGTPSSAPGFGVDVYIRDESPNTLRVTVSDAGPGVPPGYVERGLFLLGGKPALAPGPFASLNEHGLGLKQALPRLIRDTGFAFELRTGFQGLPGSPVEYSHLQGVLTTDPLHKMSGHRCDRLPSKGAHPGEAHFNSGVKPRGWNPRTGTRLLFDTSKAWAYGGWQSPFGIDPSSLDFRRFASLLNEHLGVTYRHLLSSKSPYSHGLRNSIKTRYWGSTGRTVGQFEIKPIEVPYEPGKSKKSTFTVSNGSVSIEVAYTRGISDAAVSATRQAFHKINPRAQGYDLVHHGKVLKSAVLEEVWGRNKHPGLNTLTGEILLDVTAGLLHTTSTKDGLEWNQDVLEDVRTEIQKLDWSAEHVVDMFRPTAPSPPRPPYRWKGHETTLHKLLERAFIAAYPGATTRRPHPAWPIAKTGIDPRTAADLTFEDHRGFIVMEVKKGYVDPLDLYQLRLYWDGFCFSRSPKHPSIGLLIGASEPAGVKWLRAYLNRLKDPCGALYQFQFRPLGFFSLPPSTPSGAANSSSARSLIDKLLGP